MNLFDFFSFYFHAHNERKQADAALCGRSMVEMLGVLTIIGVLSVGAISGYSKAMMKYKLNKQTEQMNTIINTVVQYYDELKATDVSGESYYLLPLLKKLNVIPEDMYIKNDEYFIKDVFGIQYRIYHHKTGYVGILSTISDKNNSFEVCQNLYSIAKSYHASVSAVLISTQTELVGDDNNYVLGDKECTTNNTCLINMNISDMADRCRICKDADKCTFYYIFR